VPMLSGAPGVAQRRLDLVLRAVCLGLLPPPGLDLGIDLKLLKGVHAQLHKRATVQLASVGQGIVPCFAQHIDLSAMPLQLLTMAYRMTPQGALFTQLTELIAANLPAYPEDVQAQTLIGMLSVSSDSTTKEKLRTRLKNLMDNSASWEHQAHAWLRHQSSRLDSMLTLIMDPNTVSEEEASGLLAALQLHHGVSDGPTLLINDPFGERYVLWSITDIRLLGALSKRTAMLSLMPSGLVDCVVDLLKQLCSVSVIYAYRFATTQFMRLFSSGVLHSAFLRLTPYEQGLMLSRVYAPNVQARWGDHMQLIQIFAMNTDIPADYRINILGVIAGYWDQSAECKGFVNELLSRIPPDF
jgi:hypothetical protein